LVTLCTGDGYLSFRPGVVSTRTGFPNWVTTTTSPARTVKKQSGARPTARTATARAMIRTVRRVSAAIRSAAPRGPASTEGIVAGGGAESKGAPGRARSAAGGRGGQGTSAIVMPQGRVPTLIRSTTESDWVLMTATSFWRPTVT